MAALGDSLTQGYGLRQSDGFVPKLADWLNAQGVTNVRLINAGVSGDTTAGGLKTAQAANVDILLIGLTAPKNYGPEYKQAFDVMYAELADAYGALYLPSFFAGITGGTALRDTDPALVQPYMQSDGIHPNASGVTNIVAAVGPSVVKLIEQARK